MRDPFKVEGPALISFSGGRTSAFMLWKILEAHGGELPDDVHVTFANTGREMPQTLDFVRDCGEHWGVPIVWLEFANHESPQGRWKITNYERASRNGEPFSALIKQKSYLPNPVTRFCTTELKIRPMKFYAQQKCGWDHWTNVLGLRADEPRRVSKAKAGGIATDLEEQDEMDLGTEGPAKRRPRRTRREPWENDMPLAQAGITKRHVQMFWQRQNFDLRLPNVNGTTPLGNCDLCFLKSVATIQSIMRASPDLAKWWINEEKHIRTSNPAGARFREKRPRYSAMLEAVQSNQMFDFGEADQALTDCFCGEGE